MNYDIEFNLRSRANALYRGGALGWDADLIAAGLDPSRWTTGQPTGMPSRQGHGYGQRFGSGGTLHRKAPLTAQSFDPADNSIEVLWTTGAGVLRYDYDGVFNEVLEVSSRAVRLARLNAGAPFLNSHQSDTLGMIIGAVVPGSARLVGGRGVCRVALSGSADNAAIVADIRGGVIRNVSVGYLVHAAVMTEGRNGGLRTYNVTDWEPIEVSAVAIPADAGAQIRTF